MNTDDLLIEFRSGVPLPDAATTERLFLRATSKRRRLPYRRLTLAIALVAATAVAGILSTVRDNNPKRPAIGGNAVLSPVTDLKFTRSGQTLTSISFTVREAIIPDVMLAIEVMNKDDGQIVFEERVPMTNTGSTVPNTPVATWSGTLSPTDWTGGCQDAQYMINTAVYRRAGYPTGDPFEPVWPSVERAFNVTGGSFICNGS